MYSSCSCRQLAHEDTHTYARRNTQTSTHTAAINIQKQGNTGTRGLQPWRLVWSDLWNTSHISNLQRRPDRLRRTIYSLSKSKKGKSKTQEKSFRINYCNISATWNNGQRCLISTLKTSPFICPHIAKTATSRAQSNNIYNGLQTFFNIKQ